MKKIFLILTALFMSVMTMAEEKTLTFDLTSNPGGWPTTNPTTLTNYTFTLDGVDYTFGLKKARYNNNGYLQLTRPAALGLPAIEGYRLTNVVAKNSSHCATDVYVGISVSSETENYISGGERQNWVTTNSSYTYELNETSNNTVYYLYVTSSNAQVTEITLTYERDIPFTVTLDSIVIKGAATKMAYEVGEAFDPAGLEVWGLYTKYVKNDSTSQITSGITWSINPETFTTVSSNASVTLSASYKDKTSSDTTIMGINVSDPVPVDYLCFTADAANSTIELTKSGSPTGVTIQYQVNGTAADGWTSVDFSTATTTGQIALANVGDKVYFRNASSEVTGFSTDASNYYQFAMTGSIAASGNVMSLVDKSYQTLTIPGNFCFTGLFQGCTSLTTAPALPATTLAANCYNGMFANCTSLTTAPALPATTLAANCYNGMFAYCTSLATAPALPATTLTDNCYMNMFAGCSSLTAAPALPATTLATYCYSNMFALCSSLTTAPALPDTTLTDNCYNGMFSYCTSLATAPALPATTLANKCYQNMFAGCTSLATAPALPATTLADDCYQAMFRSCTSLTTAPALPATTLANSCYSYMFAGCSSLTTAPALPATTLADNCYQNMFRMCSSLTAAPALPATTLANNCYNGMFANCYSLTTAPALPATTLADSCYQTMFQACTSLTTAPALPATTLANKCYQNMFRMCLSLVVNTTAPGVEWSIPAGATVASYATSNMFSVTGGDFTGEPVPGTTYYIASATIPVTYLAPAYNTVGDPTSGIAHWDTLSCTDYSLVENTTTTLTTGWYVVTGTDVQTGNLTCNGAVNLILADGAKLTATSVTDENAGITVSGNGNSLTVYAQSTDPAQMGTLFATGGDLAAGIGGGYAGSGSNITINGGSVTATGGESSAGIGGGAEGSGSDITINGGSVTATGGESGAGIGGGHDGSGSNITINGGTVTANARSGAAGIGGGIQGHGSNITINGGSVTANGGVWAAGIGGGASGSASNIFVATNLIVQADNTNPPTTVITNTGADLASSLNGSRYATVAPAPLPYLCFTAEAANSTIELTKSGSPTAVTIQYQVNGTAADGWTSVDFSTATTTGQIALANVGDKVYFRNASSEVTGFSTLGNQYYHFAMTGSIAASGNVMSLVDKSCQTQTIPGNFCFTKLFQGCTSLTTAPALPATTLDSNCYQYMFSHCSSLTAAPELPATIMATRCYQNMFEYCDSLTAAPALPATTLATYCYSNMFNKCYALMTAPALPATTLADYCYQYMFFDCDSLTTAPALPATTLAANCYGYMFANCASLTTAPALPATTLTDKCYQSMFALCASLTTAPALPATTLTDNCYQNMFAACSTLVVNTTAPGVEWSIPAGATGSSNATSNMFSGTGGDFTGAPAPGTIYYIYSALSGFTITANVNDTAMGSVTGAGKYTAGSTATLTANAKEGYRFSNWTNANGGIVSTANPWTLTVAGDTTVTANFVPLSVEVQEEVDVPAFAYDYALGYTGASSTFDTSMVYGAINCYAKKAIVYGYNPTTDDYIPRAMSIYDGFFSAAGVPTAYNSTSTPFCIKFYNDGTFWYCTHPDVAEYGAHYTCSWILVNPTTGDAVQYNFSMNDITRTANITANVNNTAIGSASGSGTYNIGSTATLTATPAAHYHFVNWSNGSTVNPLTITVEKDSSLTANFAIDQHAVATFVNNATMGEVTAGGTYDYGTQITLTATPAAHYHFVNWSNGLTVNPLTITVEKDSSLTANFAIDQHTVATFVNNATMGEVTAGGTYDYGTQITLTATPAAHYHFVNWSNGSTSNPLTITVEKDSSLTANFAIDQHAIATFVNNATMGEVTAGGTYDYGSQITLTATPAAHYHFVNWSNGSTVNPLTITVEKDSSLTANFAIDTHTVTLAANDEAFGTVEGAGTYNYGTQVTAIAVPAAHYHFVNWSNGETNDTIVIDLAGDTTLTANFAIDTHLVTLAANDEAFGTVEGAGTYNYGTQVTAIAVPAAHYHFVNWSNGETNDTIVIDLAGDTTLTANFAIDTHLVTLAVDDVSHGIVEGAGIYDYGTQAIISATADPCYHFVSWNDGVTDNPRFVEVESDTAFTANFELNVYESEFNEVACDSYTWDEDTYILSGDYQHRYATINGCDSTATLHLVVNYSNNGEFSEQAAFSYIWDGREYTESGNYTYVYQNVYGCDSTMTLHLTIASFELPVIDQLNKKAVMLSHYPNGDGEYVDYIDYRWYRDGELVAKGFDNFWEPSVLNGCYHVEVPVDETKTQWVLSNELCFQNGVLVGIDEAEEAIFSFSVAPNPVAKGSSMTITAQLPEQQLQGATLMMFDLNGRIVTTMPMSQQSVTLPAQQTSGIYVIQITTRSGEKHVQRVVVR